MSSSLTLNNLCLKRQHYNTPLFFFHYNNYYYYYSKTRCCFNRFFSSFISHSSMEVVNAAMRRSSAASDSIAIRADQKSYSYTQLISAAQNISNLLCSSDLKTTNETGNCVNGHGHLGGARIGIVAKPCAEFVAGVLGTWLSGGVAVPLALSYPEAELMHVMHDSDISMVLSTEDYREILESVATKSAAQFSLLPPVPTSASLSSSLDQSQAKATDVDGGNVPALIVYTSGTTGKPKGVVHTHNSINAQVQTLSEAWEYTSADQFLHCLPLHHVHGLFNALLAPLYAGSTVEFMPKFSVRGIWQRWRESYPENGSKANDAITVFTGVPTMYTRLIQGYEPMDPKLQAVSASAARQLRLMMCGSSALPQPVMQQWEAITGHRLLERYGMTEFVMSIANPLRGERKPGTVGKPFPGVQCKIIEDKSDESGTTAVGELCVKSPSLFKEYWKLPEVTKDSFTDDGFFKTGDAVRTDEDGYYIILGRTSADIMKVGGYKLSALEIESVLLEHPVVAECCVLGLPDKDYGDAVSAIIVPSEEAKKNEGSNPPVLNLEELCAWAKDKLAPYKLPTRLFVWDSLPRNAMGKVNKKELKKVLADEQS